MDDLGFAGVVLPPVHSPPDPDAVPGSPLPDFESIKYWVCESPPTLLTEEYPDSGAAGGEAAVGGAGGLDGSGAEQDSAKTDALGVPVVEMEKVSLGGVPDMSEIESSSSTSDDDEESESSCGSSETSEEESDDSDDEESEKIVKVEKDLDMEEGEIGEFDASMVVFSDDDEEGGASKAPIKSRNEIENLPPVPPVNDILEEHHQVKPIGVILSIVGNRVIVEGKEQHNPLNEGSILWIAESKLPLGYIDEIFGPVKAPFYVVRFNSEEEVPSDIHEGTPIAFVVEFANHVLNNKDLYRKGYDASGDNDEEISDEAEFSDDEEEAEYRRAKKAGNKGKANAKWETGDHQSSKRAYGKTASWRSKKQETSPSQINSKTKSTVNLAGFPQQPQMNFNGVTSGNFSAHAVQSVGGWPNGAVPMQLPVLQPCNGLPMVQQPTNQLYHYHPNNQFPPLGAFPTQFPFQQFQPTLGGIPPAVPMPFPMGLGLTSPMWPAQIASSLPGGGQLPPFQGSISSTFTNNFNAVRAPSQNGNKHFRGGRGGRFSGRRGH